MTSRTALTFGTFILGLGGVVACSGSEVSSIPSAPGSSGMTASGGASAASGAPGSGGTVLGSGGSGSPVTGGASGSPGAGGMLTASGGTAPATGGTATSGGAGAGGAGGSSAGSGTAGTAQGGVAASSGSGGAPLGGSGGGAGGKGGASSGGAGAATPSAGCGKATTQALNQWVEGTLMAGGLTRRWWVRLPTGYDPMRAYPVIVQLHGCGNESNNVRMDNQVGTSAILIRSVAQTECWDTSTMSPDLALFDAMISAVSDGFCSDTSRIFATGYSSGSWLINLLSCTRGNVIRAAATVAGGLPRLPSPCVGNMAQMFFHDTGDPENAISGSESARNRLLMVNQCQTQTMPQDPSPCVRYQGCVSPVVWCPTTGQAHGRQDNVAGPAFWKFFQEF